MEERWGKQEPITASRIRVNNKSEVISRRVKKFQNRQAEFLSLLPSLKQLVDCNLLIMRETLSGMSFQRKVNRIPVQDATIA